MQTNKTQLILLKSKNGALLTILSMCFLFNSIYGQNFQLKNDNQTKFDRLNQKNGLSNNSVLDIFQDKYGFMWFATIDGLNRYDGYEFLVFKNEVKNPKSLSGNLVTCITEDSYGDLWIGTHYGLNKYNRSSNSFEILMHDPMDKNSLSNNYVRAIFAGKDGILWIETVEGMLNKLDISKNDFKHYRHTGIRQPYYYNHVIYEDKEGYLWIGGRSLNPHRFDPIKEEFLIIQSDANDKTKKRENDVSCFLEDSQKRFWVSGLDGAYIFDKKESFSKFLAVSTYSIIEDNVNQIWFGTGSGLYKFNDVSNEVTNFEHNENNPSSISGNHVNKLFLDKSGTIWIATNDGISKYCQYKNKFHHYFHISGEENTLSSNKVTCVVEDFDGIIWIGTDGGGLNRFDRKSGEFKAFKNDPLNQASIKSDRISSLYIDKSGALWIGLWAGRGFDLFKATNETFVHYVYDPKSFNYDWYNDFLEDNKGDFWIGLWGGRGLYKFDRENGNYFKEEYKPKVVPPKNVISALSISGDQKIWLASDEGVFSYFNIKNGNYHYYWNLEGIENKDYETGLKLNESNVHERDFISFQKIYSVVTDLDTNSWFATDNGFYKYDFKQDLFVRIGNGIFTKNNNNLNTLFASNDSKQIWIGSNNGLYKFDLLSGKIIEVKASFKGKSQSIINIRSLFEDNNNQLWIGTKNKLIRFDFSLNKMYYHNIGTVVNSICENSDGNILIACDKEILLFLKENRHLNRIAKLQGDRINIIFCDSKEETWLGTDKGFFNLKKENNKYLLINPIKKLSYPVSLKGFEVLSIIEDQGGNLYLGSNNGFYRFYRKEGILNLIRPYENKFQNKAIHLVSKIHEDSKGKIWIGSTETGLNRLDTETDLLEQFIYRPYDLNGYQAEAVNCMMEDKQGQMWFGGDGLNKFNAENSSFTNINTKDGLPDKHVMGIVEDDHGKFWISTFNGLCEFDPELMTFITYNESNGLQSNQFSKACLKLKSGELVFGGSNGFNIFHPDSIITNSYVAPIVISGLKIFEHYFSRDLSGLKQLDFKYNENTLTFEFSALDFINPENSQYAYILEGYDEKWTHTTSKNRKIKYTRIPNGKYVFRVKGANSNGIWSDTEASLRITIHPPFWKTIWFYGLEGLILLSFVFAIISLRERKMKNRQKTLELEQKLLRSQMNPHFIFNSLGAIQSYIFKKKPLEAGAYLSDFSDLIRLILENSRREFVILEKEIKTLNYYLELQKLRYENKFEYELEVDPELDLELVMIPPMLAQPFIENSIEHGFREMKTTGNIYIRFELKNGFIRFETEDNGMGIEKSAKQKNRIEKHESLATKITKERIENINRGNKLKIKLAIVDLNQLDSNLTGTRVAFEIPYKLTDK